MHIWITLSFQMTQQDVMFVAQFLKENFTEVNTSMLSFKITEIQCNLLSRR